MKKIVLPIIIVLAVLLGGYLAMAYTVQPGDTLSKIAQDNNTTWQKLAVDNNIQNPDLIFVGDNIDITNVQEFGGVNIPTIVALFETSLASKITSSQTTMTLVSGTTKNSTTLSGTYGFIIDEGTASEEFVLATCTDTACSAMRRGLSVIDGWTEVSALKFEHRRGASVKITNYPQLAIISRILDGTTTTPAILLADTSLANSSLVGNQYALVDYVNSYVAGGFSALNVGTTKGLYALGTSPETVGINLHNQSGLAFESGTGKLKIATTTPSATGLTIRNGYMKVATTTDFVWSGSHTFANATTTGKQVIGYSHLNNATTSLNVFGDSTLSGNATVTGELYTKGRLVGATSTSGCFYTMPTPADTPTQTVNYSIQTGFTAKHIELYWVGTFDETTYNSTMMFENGTTFTGHFGEVEVGNAGATTLTTFASTTPMLYDTSGVYWYGTVSISEATTTGFNVRLAITQHVSTGAFGTAPTFCYYARP